MSRLPVLGAPVTVSTCVHYKGAQQRCSVGVDVERMRDEEMRLPCVTISGVAGAVSCDELELPNKEGRAVLGRAMRALSMAEEGLCPTCGVKVEGELAQGDVVMAKPCGHRLKVITHARVPRPKQEPRLRTGAGALERWERDEEERGGQ